MHKENFLNHYFYQLRASAGLKIPAPFTPTATRSAGVKTPAPFTPTATRSAGVKIPAPFTSTSNALQYQQPATRHNTQNRIPHTIKYHKAKKTPPFPAASPECNSGRAGKEGGFRRERNHASKVAVSLPPKARV